jgi:lipopolysaccharide transport system ATP-binding protein
MKVRLGFAVAAQMEPDVLIIDEVLAVGDLGFVLKCFKTIDTILPKTAIIFVSHNMPMVSRICTSIILMDNGKSKYQGQDVAKGIDLYYTRFVSNESNVVFTDGSIELEKVELLNPSSLENGVPMLNWGNDLIFKFRFKIVNNLDNVPIFKILIFDKEQRPVAIIEPNNQFSNLNIVDNCISFKLIIDNIQLSKGFYSINLNVSNKRQSDPILRVNNIYEFMINHEIDVWQPFLLKSKFDNLSL